MYLDCSPYPLLMAPGGLASIKLSAGSLEVSPITAIELQQVTREMPVMSGEASGTRSNHRQEKRVWEAIALGSLGHRIH